MPVIFTGKTLDPFVCDAIGARDRCGVLKAGYSADLGICAVVVA
jgi:hypothetical protein